MRELTREPNGESGQVEREFRQLRLAAIAERSAIKEPCNLRTCRCHAGH